MKLSNSTETNCSCHSDRLRDQRSRSFFWPARNNAIHQHDKKNRKQAVHSHESKQREQSVSRRDIFGIALISANQSVDEPGLAPDFGSHPTGGISDIGQGKAEQ